MISAVILASQPFNPQNNGHQLELLSPTHILELAMKPFIQNPSLEKIVLVLGHDYHHFLNSLKSLPPQVRMVIHRKPERGLGSALAVGLQSIHDEVNGVVISRGDQVVEPGVLEQLLRAFEEGKKKIVIPLYHGKRGLPWIVSLELRKLLFELEGDFTLSPFLKKHRKDVLAVQVEI